VLFVSRVYAIAPLARLAIQVLQTREGSPRQKVILDKRERTFHPRRAVRVTPFVRHEAEPEAFGKNLHLR
jgi:hypothetical protein